ncbi:hypothetical protein [Calothrix sp. PCC 6303]|uniref:hypothetical protein n=1 Tax=Calothrix sp. PCC 6303 TaxID=1170562 RepID=UPI0002A03F6A|nr:hypothetical protein [Calothrix sp. PCC 6303]AFZ03054.1 hypothetical protein Cal6303_4140 [Calothrix sp. PCC 6303]
MAKSFYLGFSLLGLTTISVISDGLTKQALATEVTLDNDHLGTEEAKLSDPNVISKIRVSVPEVIATESFSPQQKEAQIVDKFENISHSAADLQPEKQLASKPIDLDKFCKSYPYNSRCSQTPGSEQPAEPNTSENKPEEAAQVSQQNSGWAITPEIGTLGVGASITKSLTPNLNGRVGVNTISLDVGGYRKRENEVEYDANLNLLNVSTVVDYHPFKNSGFRVTGGLVFNDNNVEGKARIRDNTVFEYNGNQYTNQDISSVKGKVSFPNNVAPYLGIGWGNAVKPGKRWGFSVNLGVMFTGSPKVDLDANIVNESLRSQIVQDLQVEKKELEDDLEQLSIYPVLSLGVSYHF